QKTRIEKGRIVMGKMRMLAVLTIVVSIGFTTLCYADTVAVPFGSSNTITQTVPQNNGNYSRTDIVYYPGAAVSDNSLYAYGIRDSVFDVNGTGYTQITTTYGNTGMATVSVIPTPSTGVPTDTDAYKMAYLSALQSYGLTIDPATGQIVSVNTGE
ncbi:MAG: hypothetical protein K5668_00315, partial [Lachnospiraceae bacterium]|nr:hypothetical protein [Lachnospiraceae bacterium]